MLLTGLGLVFGSLAIVFHGLGVNSWVSAGFGVAGLSLVLSAMASPRGPSDSWYFTRLVDYRRGRAHGAELVKQRLYGVTTHEELDAQWRRYQPASSSRGPKWPSRFEEGVYRELLAYHRLYRESASHGDEGDTTNHMAGEAYALQMIAEGASPTTLFRRRIGWEPVFALGVRWGAEQYMAERRGEEARGGEEALTPGTAFGVAPAIHTPIDRRSGPEPLPSRRLRIRKPSPK